MKKILFVTLLLLTLVYESSQAQSYLGFRGSFDITSMSTGTAKSRIGFNAGMMYSTRLTDHWYFQPSLLFSLNGTRASNRAKKTDPDYSAHYYSIELPLNMSYRFGDEDMSVGFDMGVFTRYGLFGSYWVGTAEGRVEPDLFDSQKRFDIGPKVGFSTQISGVYIGYSFQLGLIKPWKERRGNYYASSINIGYLFEL